MRTLVVEDEQIMADQIKSYLEARAYWVDVAENSLQAYKSVQKGHYEFMIVEASSPKIDGLKLCQQVRCEGKKTRILLLANNTVAERVHGLNVGADDCLSKPFAFAELLARLRALGRQIEPQQAELTLQVADLALNLRTYQAQRSGQKIELSAKEFKLLELFMRHPNQVLTREMIYHYAWDHPDQQQSNVVDVFIRYLRRKIDEPFPVKLIQTVYGQGYRINIQSSVAG